MKALIIYDAVSSAKKANAALQRATHHAKAGAEWDVSPWRLTMLKSPPTAALALRDAMDAHLIIFAVRRLPGLRGWLAQWLQKWASCRLVPEAALAIAGAGWAGANTSLATFELSQLALQNRLTLIFNDDSKLVIPDEIRGTSLAPSPPPLFGRPESGVSDFGWGLND